mgnify:CR=1 FL=1
MKKFVFDLQDVLDFRTFEEDAAKAELAKCISAENEIQNNLNLIAAQYATVKTQMKGSTDYSDILSAGQFYKLLEYQKEELLKKLAEAKIVTEQKRAVLVEAMKKTEALTKLKESQLEAYKEAEKKEEENEADEINTIRAASFASASKRISC